MKWRIDNEDAQDVVNDLATMAVAIGLLWLAVRLLVSCAL